MASPIKHIPPRRIFIGESVFFPLTSCTTIATNIRTTDIAGIKNNATIPIEKKQRNAIPTYTAQSSINNLFVNLFLQTVLALPSSSVDDLFSISCRPRISISLCAFVTLGVEISCSHFAIVCLDTPSSAAKASCVSPYLNIVSCILHNSLIASALILLCPFWFSLTLATMYEHDTAAINCYNATLTTDGNFATGRASAGADR